MVLDQNEIDAMLAEHASGGGEPASGGPSAAGAVGGLAGGSGGEPPVFSREGLICGRVAMPAAITPEVQRLLRLRVPLIVRIATRRVPIHDIRRFSRGRIIEFDTPSETPLELLVNNRVIGQADPVRVGDNYGVRIREICNPRQRIESLGGTGGSSG